MKLAKWLKRGRYDYIELQGSPYAESQSTSWIRNAACYHFKRKVINSVFRKMLLCDILASFGSLIYIGVSKIAFDDVHTWYALAVVGVTMLLLLAWLLSYIAVDLLYHSRMFVISINCPLSEIPEWVIRLPEIGVPPEMSRWILVEVCNRSYVLSLETLDKIACNEVFECYLMSI